MTEPETAGPEVVVASPRRRLTIAAAIAAVVSLPFAAIPLVLVAKSIPTLEGMFRDMGGDLPPVTQLLFNLSHNAVLLIALVIIEIAVFIGMYLLAKRFWIGLVFVPPLAYLAIAVSLGLALWWPVLNIVGQVR